jgi:hypothetical protein
VLISSYWKCIAIFDKEDITNVNNARLTKQKNVIRQTILNINSGRMFSKNWTEK